MLWHFVNHVQEDWIFGVITALNVAVIRINTSLSNLQRLIVVKPKTASLSSCESAGHNKIKWSVLYEKSIIVGVPVRYEVCS